MVGAAIGGPVAARALLSAAAILAASAVALAAFLGAGAAEWIGVGAAVVYLGIGLLGLLLAQREPRNPAAWVLLTASLGAALLPVTELLGPRSGAGAPVTAVLGSLAAAAIFALFTLGVLLFPDGRGHGRLGRALVPIAWIALALLAGGGAALLDAPGGAPPADEPGVVVALSLMGLAGLGLVVPLTVLAAVAATLRRRASSGDARRGLALVEAVAWINAVAFLACAAISLLAELPDWFGAVAEQTGVVFAVAAWVGIVRFRLVDLRIVAARTLPYLIASALVVAVATAVAALMGTAATGWLGAGIGAVVAALVALSLRGQLQTLANLVVYGRRVDPATEHARRLEQALHDSHRLLVTARDDERRRIRRDLHDGLGPTLAGIALGVESAERHLDDPARARAELARLHDASREAVTEVRRIVYALRPPALDSLGLDGAVREQAERLGATSVEVADLPELPDTLEVGVYLVALEAMRNAATHARPGSFWVRLSAATRLALEVHDDGPGLPAGYRPGVGIQSMRDRVAELGGTLDVIPRQPRGTLVRAEWALQP